MVLVGLPLGIISARYRGSWVDNLIRLVTLLGVSAPSFVWAVILMLLFAFFLPIFPIAGRITDSYTIDPVTGFLFIDTLLAGNVAAFGDAAWHIILPAFALALSGIPVAKTTAGVRVGLIDGQYVINPTYTERKASQLDLIVAGSRDGIVMVEANSLKNGAFKLAPGYGA